MIENLDSVVYDPLLGIHFGVDTKTNVNSSINDLFVLDELNEIRDVAKIFITVIEWIRKNTHISTEADALKDILVYLIKRICTDSDVDVENAPSGHDCQIILLNLLLGVGGIFNMHVVAVEIIQIFTLNSPLFENFMAVLISHLETCRRSSKAVSHVKCSPRLSSLLSIIGILLLRQYERYDTHKIDKIKWITWLKEWFIRDVGIFQTKTYFLTYLILLITVSDETISLSFRPVKKLVQIVRLLLSFFLSNFKTPNQLVESNRYSGPRIVQYETSLLVPLRPSAGNFKPEVIIKPADNAKAQPLPHSDFWFYIFDSIFL